MKDTSSREAINMALTFTIITSITNLSSCSFNKIGTTKKPSYSQNKRPNEDAENPSRKNTTLIPIDTEEPTKTREQVMEERTAALDGAKEVVAISITASRVRALNEFNYTDGDALKLHRDSYNTTVDLCKKPRQLHGDFNTGHLIEIVANPQALSNKFFRIRGPIHARSRCSDRCKYSSSIVLNNLPKPFGVAIIIIERSVQEDTGSITDSFTYQDPLKKCSRINDDIIIYSRIRVAQSIVTDKGLINVGLYAYH